MAKKGGVLTFLTGLAMGAAAVFLSDEKNRKMVTSEAKKAASKAKSAQKKAVSKAKRAVKKGRSSLKKAARQAKR